MTGEADTESDDDDDDDDCKKSSMDEVGYGYLTILFCHLVGKRNKHRTLDYQLHSPSPRPRQLNDLSNGLKSRESIGFEGVFRNVTVIPLS